MVNGNKKGALYENKIAKLMTEWTKGAYEFYRSPSSGSFGSQKLGIENMGGDIIAPTSIADKFPFTLELKNRETWKGTLNSVFHNNNDIPSYIEQGFGDAIRESKVPMVLLHANRSKNYMIVPYSQTLVAHFSKNNLDWMSTDVSYYDEMKQKTHKFHVMVVVFDTFLEEFTLEEVLEEGHEWFSDWYDILPELSGLTRITGTALVKEMKG